LVIVVALGTVVAPVIVATAVGWVIEAELAIVGVPAIVAIAAVSEIAAVLVIVVVLGIVVVVDVGTNGEAGLFYGTIPDNAPQFLPPIRAALADLQVG